MEDKSLMAKPPNSVLQTAESRVLREGLLRTELAEAQEASSSAVSGKLGKIMSQLYDVECSYSEPEKSLPLDLGLDQIEDYQE
ncbi:MAG: hypothetical protein OEZ35_02040 [Candidatus Bathyarchaeota archaeon]|nr:hypothetical protein [Candidatus Bathyarchaeota archaeon]